VIKEACVQSFEEAVLTEQRGADRVELCARLDLDGVTKDNLTELHDINVEKYAVVG